MKNFVIKRTWSIHNYSQKCDHVNYLTMPAYANAFGQEYWQPDINKAFIFDNEPLKKYLGEDCNYTAKNFYPEMDFVDKEHDTPDFAYKQEHIEVEIETEKITIPEITREVVKIKRVINN
jgi:hypothetical protein